MHLRGNTLSFGFLLFCVCAFEREWKKRLYGIIVNRNKRYAEWTEHSVFQKEHTLHEHVLQCGNDEKCRTSTYQLEYDFLRESEQSHRRTKCKKKMRRDFYSLCGYKIMLFMFDFNALKKCMIWWHFRDSFCSIVPQCLPQNLTKM